MPEILVSPPLLTRIERLRATRLHRLVFSLVIACACLYAKMTAVDGMKYVGTAPSLVGYTLRSLSADAFDAISIYAYKLTGRGFGISPRPTRFALICASADTNEADNAIAEKQIRGQIMDLKSGYNYALMTSAMRDGREQPVFILTRFGAGGTRFCAVRSYPDQECTCGGQYNAKGRSRVLALDLFGTANALR